MMFFISTESSRVTVFMVMDETYSVIQIYSRDVSNTQLTNATNLPLLNFFPNCGMISDRR
jgi:hypothetical protein